MVVTAPDPHRARMAQKRTPFLSALEPSWEKGVRGMRSASARECRKRSTLPPNRGVEVVFQTTHDFLPDPGNLSIIQGAVRSAEYQAIGEAAFTCPYLLTCIHIEECERLKQRASIFANRASDLFR
jgi:hypothetical protein